MNFIKCIATLGLTLALAACGGGGGDPGTAIGKVTSDASNSTTPSTAPSGFVFSLDKSAINNGGTDAALLTITALDAARNVISGVPVSVSLDSGAYSVISGTTDVNGQASGKISIGGNKANRNITATITVGTQISTAVVAVTGSKISVTSSPATAVPGASVGLTVKATDVNGNGISGAAIQLGGTFGFTQLVTTDSLGTYSVTPLAAPAIAATYSVTAAGLGVTALTSIQVTGGGSVLPDAIGPIGAASLAITPAQIFPNVSGGTTNRAAIKAVFLNSSNQAVQNVRVRFEIMAPGLGSGEQLSTADTTVYSDANGMAVADYIAGTRTSPTDGVIIRACYGLTDAAIASGACPNSRTATLTVAGQPLSITLGDNNLLSKGGNSLTYIKLFDVAVADSAGNAVSNALVSASVDITRYEKGLYAGPRFSCLNEDTNRNGVLEAQEIADGDGDNVISPRKADVILSFLGANTTGTNGRTTIQVEYPQNVATWLNYTVRVTTNVAGSEGTAVKSYRTTFIVGDDTNGSFLTPPYGVNNCLTPN